MCDKSGEDDEEAKDRAEDEIRDDSGTGQRDEQMLDQLQTEMGWACAEEGQWIYRWRDAEGGTARREAQRKIYGCCERRHEVSWCECRGLG